MQVTVGIGLSHRRRQFTRQVVINGVHDLGPVQGDQSDTAVFLVKNFRHAYSQSLMDLTSRNSSSPQTPLSRPLPDCFMPPKGEPAPPNLPFISTIPERSCRATPGGRGPCRRSERS